MKKDNKFLMALAAAVLLIAPFITNTASACASRYAEAEIPDCLK